ncbi:MAG: radical SAM family heme chaperone HemW [Actinomycetota bacterium]
MSGFGVYVHVPFCSALCPYCDFAVVVGRKDVHARYFDALVNEAASYEGMPVATSMFVGGGTPTVVEAELLVQMLVGIQSRLSLVEDAEVTIEANPESVSFDKMRSLREAGVTRVSIGAQSFAAHVLRGLGRTHSVAQITDAVAAARAAGIENVSLDLIYGGAGESIEDWQRTLGQALELNLDHISCYALTIEAATPFGKAVARGTMSEPDQDDLAAKYELACEMLARAGYHHYEISNWARPGFESRHNLLYWTQGNYVGLGIGAHSHRDGVRWWNARALTPYLVAPARARADEERLSPDERAEEWVSLRMRLLDGVDLNEATKRLGRAIHDQADACAVLGLATLEGNTMRLTTRGMLLENEVTGLLLGSKDLALGMVEC